MTTHPGSQSYRSGWALLFLVTLLQGGLAWQQHELQFFTDPFTPERAVPDWIPLDDPTACSLVIYSVKPVALSQQRNGYLPFLHQDSDRKKLAKKKLLKWSS